MNRVTRRAAAHAQSVSQTPIGPLLSRQRAAAQMNTVPPALHKTQLSVRCSPSGTRGLQPALLILCNL
jgi:hypothetical protein